jgi:GNAT superfamily N-acetyltransferase
MEDQAGEFLVDTQEGVLVGGVDNDPDGEFSEEELSDGDRFISLPEWDSSDGYQLMERFAAGFRNPVIRARLTAALDRGRGVFRAFKDVLGQYPEAERFWFSFKEREMKRAVLRWYNALREEWGLERIGGEPEETDDLVLEDFRFRDPREGDEAAAAELHRLCLKENPRINKETGGRWEFPGFLALAAETGAGDFIAYISTARKDRVLHIVALEVRPEYRGLGVGETLLSRLLEKIDRKEIHEVLIDLPVEAGGFSPVLLRESFEPWATRYCIDLRDPDA